MDSLKNRRYERETYNGRSRDRTSRKRGNSRSISPPNSPYRRYSWSSSPEPKERPRGSRNQQQKKRRRLNSRGYSPVTRGHSPIRPRFSSPSTYDYSPLSRDYSSTSRDFSAMLRDRSLSPEGRNRFGGTPEHRNSANYGMDSFYEDSPTYEKRGYFPYSGADKFKASRNGWTGRYNNGTGNGDFDQYWNRNNGASTHTFVKYVENVNAPRSPVICKFYNTEATCQKGTSCPFLHLCKYFINDDCKFGRVCKRSHNIFDKQPRSVLKKYGLIPEGNRFDKQKIIDSIKENLKNVYVCNKMSNDETKSALDRPLTAVPKDSSTEAEVDSFDVNQSDWEESDHGGLGDFIPLETNRKIDKTRKKKKKTRKMKKCKREGDTGRLKPNQDSDDNADDTDVQLSIIFATQHQDRNFRVRQIRDQWQISSMCGAWRELDTDDTEIFSDLYRKAFEIREQVLPWD